MDQHHFAAATAPISDGEPSPVSSSNSVSGPSATAALGAIFLAVFFLSMASALQSTAVVLRAGIENFNDLVIGVTMAAYYLGFLTGFLVSPFVLTTGAYGRTFAGFASIASAGALAHLLVINPTAWITLRFVHGVCIASMLVVAERRMSSLTPPKSRALVLGLYAVMHVVAMGIGQPLLGIFGSGGFRLLVVVSILTSLSLVPLTITRGNRVLDIPAPSLRLKSVFLGTPASAIGLVAAGFMSASIWSLGPRYGIEIGLTTTETGLFMAATALGAVLALGAFTALRNHLSGRAPVAIIMAFGTIGSLVLLVGASFDFSLYFALAAVSGACITPLYSLSISSARELLGTPKLVSTAGSFLVFYLAGAILGPVITSLAMAAFGSGGLFGAIVLVQAFIFMIVLRRKVRIPDTRSGTSARFQPYPHTTHTAYSLLDRTRFPTTEQRPDNEPGADSSGPSFSDFPREPASGTPYTQYLHTDLLSERRLRA